MNPPTKLPVRRLVVDAYAFLFRNWREAVRVGGLPLIAAIALGLLVDHLPNGDEWPSFVQALYGFTIRAAYAPIAAIAVVPWHRYILLKDRVRIGSIRSHLSTRTGRYVLLSVAIMAIVTGMNWAASFLAYSSGWLAGPETILVFVRVALFLSALGGSYYVFAVLALALPAVAVNRDEGLGSAVRLGYRNGWRVALVVLATAVPYYAYYYGNGLLPESAFEGIRQFVWTASSAITYVFESLLIATGLSLCYRALGGLRGGPSAFSVIPPSSNA